MNPLGSILNYLPTCFFENFFEVLLNSWYRFDFREKLIYCVLQLNARDLWLVVCNVLSQIYMPGKVDPSFFSWWVYRPYILIYFFYHSFSFKILSVHGWWWNWDQPLCDVGCVFSTRGYKYFLPYNDTLDSTCLDLLNVIYACFLIYLRLSKCQGLKLNIKIT